MQAAFILESKIKVLVKKLNIVLEAQLKILVVTLVEFLSGLHFFALNVSLKSSLIKRLQQNKVIHDPNIFLFHEAEVSSCMT